AEARCWRRPGIADVPRDDQPRERREAAARAARNTVAGSFDAGAPTCSVSYAPLPLLLSIWTLECAGRAKHVRPNPTAPHAWSATPADVTPSDRHTFSSASAHLRRLRWPESRGQ